jgi:hypothetical protein
LRPVADITKQNPSVVSVAFRSFCLSQGVILRSVELRRIFGPKRDEVTGEWRKLHNEELRDLYSSPSIIKMIK